VGCCSCSLPRGLPLVRLIHRAQRALGAPDAAVSQGPRIVCGYDAPSATRSWLVSFFLAGFNHWPAWAVHLPGPGSALAVVLGCAWRVTTRVAGSERMGRGLRPY